ncbi:MAG: BolA family transcriptional regulator [bacterium]|nr:BolA family transcriptional regulator [bacterium]MCP5071579.1 BolA family transcriptional regulator [bacterium]
MSERSDELEAALRERLDAVHVEVEDDSHLHAGHVGAREGGGHFRALIVSGRFEGLSRVQAQRAVFDALAIEMKEWIHALSVRTLTPAQWDTRSD